MRRNNRAVGVVMLILSVLMLSLSGRAKKAVATDAGLTVAEQKAAPSEVKPGPAPALTADELKEQALRRDAAAAAESKAAVAAEKIQFDDIRFAFDKSNLEPAAR